MDMLVGWIGLAAWLAFMAAQSALLVLGRGTWTDHGHVGLRRGLWAGGGVLVAWWLLVGQGAFERLAL